MSAENINIEKSKISVISFCLNSGAFLRETIESVLKQTYKNYELIIKDGGSTDDTLEILKEYPQVKWVSEKEYGDNPILDAIWQSFYMSRGEYIIFLAISDCIVDQQWFRRCVETLDMDTEISWVWGLPQNITEDSKIDKLWFAEFLEQHPPQKMDFLSYWLATGHFVESNACFRRSVFETCFPTNQPDDPFRFHSTIGLNYRLNTMGYIPFFIPTVSYFGRAHEHQLQQIRQNLLDSIMKLYDYNRIKYRKEFLSEKIIHRFRDGNSKVIHEVGKNELRDYRKKVLMYRLKAKLRRDLQKLMDHIRY